MSRPPFYVNDHLGWYTWYWFVVGMQASGALRAIADGRYGIAAFSTVLGLTNVRLAWPRS